MPQGSRNSRGRPIVNIFPLQDGEKITVVLPVKEFSADKFVFMGTALGTVKKTPLEAFGRCCARVLLRSVWMTAIT